MHTHLEEYFHRRPLGLNHCSSSVTCHLVCNFFYEDTAYVISSIYVYLGKGPPDKCATENYFLISKLKHVLWVLKRTVSMDKKIIAILR